MRKLFTIIFAIALLNSVGLCQIPTSGLIADYPFTGNANDLSGNGYNCTAINTTLTQDRFGNLNSAYSFNGTSSYLINNDFNLPATGSISLWYNISTDQTNKGLI